ncbi:MAG: class I SAM-dependent methyltransferase [Thaumarchaeota archaeon]|nr:class I SAM-dependent methyltransferase [Nitrososphaerota archaeon]
MAGFIGYFFLSGFIWGAGYYPTSRKEIDAVVKLLHLSKDSRFYDLGSGYGRMIVGVGQKFGIKSIGVEADPLKYWWTRQVISRKKLGTTVSVIHSNFLNVDLKDADGVFVFLSSETKIMRKLQEKLFQEMRPGARVVSYIHRFKNWTPEEVEGKLSLYSIPERSGTNRAELGSLRAE